MTGAARPVPRGDPRAAGRVPAGCRRGGGPGRRAPGARIAGASPGARLARSSWPGWAARATPASRPRRPSGRPGSWPRPSRPPSSSTSGARRSPGSACSCSSASRARAPRSSGSRKRSAGSTRTGARSSSRSRTGWGRRWRRSPTSPSTRTSGGRTCPSSGTFAGSLVALAAVAGILAGGPVDARVGATAPAGGLVDAVVADVRAAADAAAAASADLLATPDDTGEQLFAWLGGRPTIVALGRGTGRAAAEMASLTLMEAAGVPALSLPTAEFRHGPLEILGPDVAVVLFALEPVTETLDRTFAAELTAAGAAVLLVGPVRPRATRRRAHTRAWSPRDPRPGRRAGPAPAPRPPSRARARPPARHVRACCQGDHP